MKFLLYLVVSMYLTLNTSYAMLRSLYWALEKIKQEKQNCSVEIIKKLSGILVNGGGDYNIANEEGNRKYAKILLKFILTGQLDNEKGETIYRTRISKRHFATEEERDILSTAIMKTACIDLSLEQFIEEVIAKETHLYAKRHQKVVQQLFHLAGLMLKEPYLYSLPLFMRLPPECALLIMGTFKMTPFLRG